MLISGVTGRLHKSVIILLNILLINKYVLNIQKWIFPNLHGNVDNALGLNRFYCRDSTNKICFHWFIRFKYRYNTITRSTNNIGIQDFFGGETTGCLSFSIVLYSFSKGFGNLALCPERVQNDWMICLMTQYGRQGNPIPHNSPTGLPLHLKIMPQYFRYSS
jgi:hypothetical protein